MLNCQVYHSNHGQLKKKLCLEYQTHFDKRLGSGFWTQKQTSGKSGHKKNSIDLAEKGILLKQYCDIDE